jgi:hypothetical protein
MSFLRRALGGGDKAPDWASFMKGDAHQTCSGGIAAR